VSAQAWIRYWAAGWVLSPVLGVYGVVSRDLGIAFLGVVLLFTTIGMRAFWRQKLEKDPPKEST
jgi:hypothetical protein